MQLLRCILIDLVYRLKIKKKINEFWIIFMVLLAKVVLIACCPILLSGEIIGCYLPVGNSTFRGLYFKDYYVPHFLQGIVNPWHCYHCWNSFCLQCSRLWPIEWNCTKRAVWSCPYQRKQFFQILVY